MFFKGLGLKRRLNSLSFLFFCPLLPCHYTQPRFIYFKLFFSAWFIQNLFFNFAVGCVAIRTYVELFSLQVKMVEKLSRTQFF